MRRRYFRNLILAGLIIIVTGIIRLPIEHSITAKMKAKHFWPETIDMKLRDEAGQLAISAALGGFRSLAASILGFEAFNHWSLGRYDKADALNWVVVYLQPRHYFNWYRGQQNAAYDKASVIQNDENRPANWERRYRAAFDEGARFMEEAEKFIPDDFRIYATRAVMYQEKFRPWPPDFCKSAEFYKKASECPDTKPYYKRFYAYSLSQCPGKEEESYQLLMALYEKGQRFPSLLTHIQRLEETLQIDPAQRISRPVTDIPDIIRRPGY